MRPVNEVLTVDGERSFFTLVTATFAILVVIGFARTFFLRSLFPEAQSYAAPELIFYVHGVIFTAWIGLLVIQAILIRAQRIDIHRLFGWIGVGIAVLVVILGTYGSLVAAQRPGGFIGVPLPPLQFLIFTSRGLSYLLIVALIIWGWRSSGRIHSVTLWGAFDCCFFPGPTANNGIVGMDRSREFACSTDRMMVDDNTYAPYAA